MSFRDALLKTTKKSTFGDALRSQKPVKKFTVTPAVSKPSISAPKKTVLETIADKAKQRKADYEDTSKQFVTADLSKPMQQSPEELARVESFRQREQEDRARREAEADKLTTAKLISKPFTLISRGIEKSLGGKPRVSTAIEGAVTGAVRQTPLIGKMVVPESELKDIRSKQEFTTDIKLPFIGKTEISPVEVGSAAAGLGFTAAQYSAVNNALKGLGATSKLGSLLGKSKLAKFGATQAVDLLADVVVQAPTEWYDAVTNDKTLTEDVKGMLKARGLDVLINLAVGGAFEGIEGLKRLKNSNNLEVIDLVDDAVKNIPDGPKKITIQEELGLKPDVTAQQFKQATEAPEFVESVAKEAQDLRVEDSLKQFESPRFKEQEQLQALAEGRRITDVVEPPKKTFRESLLQPEAAKTVDAVKPLDAIAQEAKQIEPVKTEAIKQVETPVIKETNDVVKEIVSPRTPDIATPEIGTSKSPFVKRIQDFTKKDPTTAAFKRELSALDELPTTTNEARTLIAQQIVKDDLEKAVKVAKDGRQFGSRVESEIGRLAVEELQRLGRHAESVELISKMSQKFRAAGQDIQSASMWAKTSPEGMQKWAVDTLENGGVKVDPDLIKEVGQDIKNINEMTPEQLAEMVSKRLGKDESKTVLNQIQNSFSYEQLKATNTATTMQKVIDKIPVLKARKLSSVQAMSHLLNGRTFLRNIFGNTASIGAEMISKVPASVADRALSMFTGNRSVIADMPQWKKKLKEGWKQGQRSFFEIKAGVGRGKSGKYEALFGNTFKSKIGKGLEKTLSLSLQTPDEFFKGFSKADSLFNQVQARLGKDVKNWSFDEVMNKATMEEIQQAIKETEFVTFQNDSALAEIMSKTKALLNKGSTEILGRVPGLKNVFTEDFGLGDMTLKYTRVPGNIITRGFEYSPAGYVKAADGIFNMMKNSENISPQLQREIALQIGRATTGTGLILLGMKLNDIGIITGAEQSRDYDVGSFDRAEGLGNYKVNMDALKRLVTGGDPSPQPGDTLDSYNWAQPLVTPIAVGARLSEEKPGTPEEAVKALGMGTFEEAMDLPTLWVVKKMFYESMSGDSTPYDVLTIPAKEALPGFVPSVVRQTAQAIDPVLRETKSGATNPFIRKLTPLLGPEATGKIQANIPGLSKDLLPKIDPLGRTQERAKGVFANLISPSTKTTLQPTEFGDKLRQVADLTGKTSVFPDRKPPNTTSFKNVKYSLTPEEKVRWQQVEGEAINKLYTEFFKDVDQIDVQDAEQIVEILERIKKEAGNSAKFDMLERRGE